jgi:pimeloyl-ACP methyl ester carboxylesterase
VRVGSVGEEKTGSGIAGLAATWSGSTDPADPAVAFVHGAPDTGRSFLAAAERLSHVRVLTYDRRGYGRSLGAQPPPRSLGDHAADLLALLGDQPTTVVGHSFGSCVAMLAAIQRPDVIVSLGLWEPPLPWEDWWPERSRRSVAGILADPDPDAVGERLVRTVLGDAAWDELGPERQQRRRLEGRAFVEDARAQLTRQFDLADIHVPAVVAYGSDTWPWGVETTTRAATILGAELIEVQGSHHFGHVTHPAEFAAFTQRAMELAPPR